MRPPEWPHTPADMPSLSAWSVENAERSTVDAHGVKTARNESCGAVSADSTTAKNIAISLLLWISLSGVVVGNGILDALIAIQREVMEILPP